MNGAPRAEEASPAQTAQVAQPSRPLPPQTSLLPGAGNPVLAGRSPSDLMRFQTFSKAQADLRQTQALDGLMRNMSGNGSTLDLARSMGTARQLRSGTTLFEGRLNALSMGDVLPAHAVRSRKKSPAKAEGGLALGQLSARFESGRDGIAAIGYDRNGGTSYGKYQIASRVGSMKNFLNFLDDQAPDLAERLRKSGPANTGSRRGAMPDEWRAIAGEQPERFEALQEAFIHESHYKPAVAAIAQRTSLDADSLSPAMREVIWSTAVQHGPAGAARLFDRASSLSGNPADPAYERKLINNVYTLRAGQFGSSSSQVQAAVQNRFREERLMALSMLDAGRGTALA
ncbi:MAG: hypothetical protein Q4F27_01375 [Desulfovibrionaceae bacterium]|nr:hypothetical protein [Desulfovibrionaceae bacterium]